MNLFGHRGRFLAALSATAALALAAPDAHAQSAEPLEQADAEADRFTDPPRADPDGDADREASPTAAPVLPETAEIDLSGNDGDRPRRRVRDAAGRLVPSRPGAFTVAPRPPQGRATPARRAGAVAAPSADGTTSPRSNVAASPVQTGAATANVPGPYEPLGLRLGPLRLVTTVEQSIGTTSNAEFTPNGRGSAFSETRFGLSATSDLPLHELRGSITGAYRKFFEDVEDLPTLDAEGAFRYDVQRGTSITFGGNWSVRSESATDDSLLGLSRTPTARPLVQAGAAFVEAERAGGRVFGRLRGSIGRELYEDIEFTDGTRLSQGDREATVFEAALRLGYRHTEALQPFVETELGYRLHDEELDRNGQNRDATRFALRAGVQVDLNEKLTGSAAVGIEGIVYESAAFDDTLGPSIAARLDWSPNRLTQIGLIAETLFDDSVTAGLGGSLDYRFGVELNRQLRDNLALFGTLSLNLGDPGGAQEETTYAAEAGLAWNINRALALTGRVSHSRVESALANADYDVTSASIGLRWQR